MAKLDPIVEFREDHRKVRDLKRVTRLAINGDITLLYAARDEEHNNARVLAGIR